MVSRKPTTGQTLVICYKGSGAFKMSCTKEVTIHCPVQWRCCEACLEGMVGRDDALHSNCSRCVWLANE